MINRRSFIKKSGLGLGFFALPTSAKFLYTIDYISKRPNINQRKFTSQAVENTIKTVKKSIADEELAWMFENCFPNTLDTTVKFYQKNNKFYTYVITGDIDAMWLRDSSAQVFPYLSLANEDKKLKDLLKGVINKQVQCVLLDPYANAFFDDSSKISEWKNDSTQMKPGVHERKWEVDSLCYVMRLSYHYWKTTGDSSVFDAEWKKSMLLILQTFKEQQRKNSKGPYWFQRSNGNALDTQFAGGFGNPTKKIGLIHSMFRPSDDATFYPFLISSNMFAAVSLRQIAEIFSMILKDETSSIQFKDLAKEVDEAIQKYAILNHPEAGKIYALEIDGFGNALFMDDANVPNLLSIPYLGYASKEDEVYKNTRRFSLSHANPWFSSGKFAKGIGGPHIGEHKIWPLGLIMQALTTDDEEEIISCLKMLKATHAGTGFIHESFDVDNPKDFTRSWFAWANTLFGELILHLYKTKPEILKRKF
ncbi:meiotically up-regulated gene 157 (Mug157) protein [Chryseobacterium ginsenosidimutans]|uniref:Meiotically up-regulated gene 157 (Mug157) protein n=1 Tax=Chryseobacterium geocarposphaerae TaxID=1416776 RepID=A0ABU1LI71_9FLAO|nr:MULTISPECIES: glycoside hydrolase family 125 protein [Chryseobacterium]MDR6406399.1 meiotically up-regulated gene 157 (Mug157) protein [Chryseobacterium geocarposphaerae]MDR6699162.1 meiotically up-regulated gene 157 (Mug157) protein [Chryseobacterium ginsenosidimutans]